MANAKQIVPDTGIDLRRGRRRESVAEISRRWIEQQKQRKEAEEQRRKEARERAARREAVRRQREAERLGELVSGIPTSTADIIAQVAFWSNVSIEDILGKSRRQAIKDARWDAIVAVYENCRFKGERFGIAPLGRIFGIDHTSALHCLKKRGVYTAPDITKGAKKDECGGFRCPSCNSREIKIVDSRPESSGRRRRRECISCGKRFSTIEKVVESKS